MGARLFDIRILTVLQQSRRANSKASSYEEFQLASGSLCGRLEPDQLEDDAWPRRVRPRLLKGRGAVAGQHESIAQ